MVCAVYSEFTQYLCLHSVCDQKKMFFSFILKKNGEIFWNPWNLIRFACIIMCAYMRMNLVLLGSSQCTTSNLSQKENIINSSPMRTIWLSSWMCWIVLFCLFFLWDCYSIVFTFAYSFKYEYKYFTIFIICLS